VLKRNSINIHQNGQRSRPDSHPTEITEDEVNAHLGSGSVRLPAGGVGAPGGDFGRDHRTVPCGFRSGTGRRANSNSLLKLFSGVHEVVVSAEAVGSNHKGRVQVNSVVIDGIEVPRFVLELFVDSM